MENTEDIKLNDKKYLRTANGRMPFGWKLREMAQITKEKRITFRLYLVKTDEPVIRAWPVVINMPRWHIKIIVADIERRGFIALLDSPVCTYTASIDVPGYEPETKGLKEAILEKHPKLFEEMEQLRADKKKAVSITTGSKCELDRLLNGDE